MKRFLILPLFCSLLLGEEPTEIKEGHSHQGHAFNEGPRQASPLIGNTGKVHLPITSSWNQGQAYFNQGLGQLHGFWYYEAERSFRKILAHDPNCAMAYWGLSQANFSNEKRAKEFIAKATELLKKEHLKITPHERAYLDSEIAYHDDKKEKDSKKRIKNFIRAYEDLILNHPDDIEAKALLVCRRWQFNRKGVPISSYLGLDAILEQIFAKEPNHPAHHYAIHLWDNRKHEQALDSAARLGKTAPGIAHMWHMPGHIYSKAKRYHDAVFSQQSSARVDHAHMAKHFLIPDQIHNYAHNNEWLSRNFGHLGDAPAALAMAKSLLANPRHPKLNTLEGRSHSYKYGRNNLLKTLEKFELWEETFELSNTQWLETLPKQPTHDRARLRLIGIANFHLGHRVELMQIINQVEELLADEKAKKQADEDKAKEKATKEKKKEGEIKKAVAAAGKKYSRLIGSLEKDCSELLGYLAEMNDDEKTAKESLAKSSGSATFKALRELQFGNKEAAEKAARSVLDGDKKETVSLANAITLFHRMGKKEDAKKGFEKLRVFSSEVDLKSRPFARLAPIAKEFGYPADWRQATSPPTISSHVPISAPSVRCTGLLPPRLPSAFRTNTKRTSQAPAWPVNRTSSSSTSAPDASTAPNNSPPWPTAIRTLKRPSSPSWPSLPTRSPTSRRAKTTTKKAIFPSPSFPIIKKRFSRNSQHTMTSKTSLSTEPSSSMEKAAFSGPTSQPTHSWKSISSSRNRTDSWNCIAREIGLGFE